MGSRSARAGPSYFGAPGPLPELRPSPPCPLRLSPQQQQTPSFPRSLPLSFPARSLSLPLPRPPPPPLFPSPPPHRARREQRRSHWPRARGGPAAGSLVPLSSLFRARALPSVPSSPYRSPSRMRVRMSTRARTLSLCLCLFLSHFLHLHLPPSLHGGAGGADPDANPRGSRSTRRRS